MAIAKQVISLLGVTAFVAMTSCAAGQNSLDEEGGDSGSSNGSGAGAGTGPVNISGTPGAGGSIVIPAGGGSSSAGTGPITKEDVIGHPVDDPAWNCGDGCLADGVPPENATLFDAAPRGGSAPTLLYPLAETLHPVNLPEITIQWRRSGPSQTVFRLQFTSEGRVHRFYVPCAPILGATEDECAYTVREAEWFDFTFENRGKPTSLTIAASDAGFSSLGTSPESSFYVSEYPVTGGLYYWSTAIRGTYRLVFGAKKADPFIEPLTSANPTECGGCHAVSRDGTTIAFTQGTADGGHLTVADTADPATPRIAPEMGMQHDSSMIALSPDGKRSLTSFLKDKSVQVLELRDTADGHVIRTITSADLGALGGPYFPEFSPDGRAVVLTLSVDPVVEWSVRQGSIATLPFDPATDTFGMPQVIVEGGAELHFYPTWSPDGKWVAFASAPATMNRASYDQSEARLRLVSSAGGMVYELGLATQGSGHASTWPKFSPFLDPTGSVMYITFNSKIDYGATLKNSELLDQARPQLWMSGIDLRRLESGDPSYAPIWLPFQEVDQNNHLGYWTEKVICSLEGGCGGNEQLQCIFGQSNGEPGECTVVK